MPVTSLCRLVKDIKFGSLEETYLFHLPIKESEIIEVFLGSSFKDEVLKIMPMQKQTHADRQTGFKTFVAIGDSLLNVPVRWPQTSMGPSCLAKVSSPGAARPLGERDQQAPHRPLQGDWTLQLHAVAPRPWPRGPGVVRAAQLPPAAARPPRATSPRPLGMPSPRPRAVSCRPLEGDHVLRGPLSGTH